MIYELKLPSLGADMESARFVEWKIKAGEKVKKNQEVAIIETSKAAVSIESFKAGTVVELLGKPKEIYRVGEVLAKIEVEEPESELLSLRDLTARAMARSKKEIPHYYIKTKAQVDNLFQFLDQLRETSPQGERLSVPAALLFLLSRVLIDFPEFNGVFENQKFIAKEPVNIGIAISLKNKGVVVPAIIESQKLDLFQINEALNDLITRARSGNIKTTELVSGTFTVTNLGDLGVEEVFGVIVPPQVAIMGWGAIHQEPVVISNSEIKAKSILTISLSADHRVSDGLLGASFLKAFTKAIENPKTIFEARQG